MLMHILPPLEFSLEPNPKLDLFSKPIPPLGFLAQSASAGCTYVLSQSSFVNLQVSIANLITRYTFINVYSHDIYIHQVIRLCGHRWCYDSQPFILYRQHANNDWGSRSLSLLSIRRRLTPLFCGKFFSLFIPVTYLLLLVLLGSLHFSRKTI